MRGAPGNHSALLGSAEEFFHIPLSPEAMHDAAGTPVMLIGAKHASTQAGTFQGSPPYGIDVPVERELPRAFLCRCYHKVRQVFAL